MNSKKNLRESGRRRQNLQHCGIVRAQGLTLSAQLKS
jgi:hypothetical protein